MLVDFVKENADEMNDPVYGKLKLSLKDDKSQNQLIGQNHKQQTSHLMLKSLKVIECTVVFCVKESIGCSIVMVL